MTTSFGIKLFVTIVLTAIGLPEGEAAQQAGTDAPTKLDENQIEEIVVTATRRESKLQKTPQSIGVLTGENLADAGVSHIHDFWRMIPSLSVTDRGLAGNRFIIRGLAGSSSNENAESLTALYLDDTYLVSPQGLFSHAPSFRAVDLERVEVLRGPQGTLFGANSMGGAIRMITNKPNPAAFEQAYEISLSETSHGGTNYGLTATLNLPNELNRSAVRVNAYRFDDDGFIDDVGSGEKNVNQNITTGIRLAVATEITEDLSLGGMVAFEDVQSESFPYVDRIGKPSVGLGTSGDYQVALLVDDYRDEENLVASINLNYATVLGDLATVMSYMESETALVFDFSGPLRAGPLIGSYLRSPAEGADTQKAFSHELRLTSAQELPVSWLAGLYFADMKFDRHAEILAPGVNALCGGCTGLPDGNEYLLVSDVVDDRTEFGVFGDLTFQFTDRLEAIVGMRWFDMDREATEISTGNFADFNNPLATVRETKRFADRGVTTKGTLSYQWNDNVSIYALAAQGFRAGGANELFAASNCSVPETFDSDSLWNYEIGVKSRLLGNKLTLNGTAYRVDWSDAQLLVAFPFPCLGDVAVNSGGVTVNGLEIETAFYVDESWDFTAGVGFTDSSLDKAVPGIGAPAGRALAFVPNVTWNAAATYRFKAFRDKASSFRVDFQHVGRLYNAIGDITLVPRQHLPSYSTMNLQLGTEIKGWQISLFANNLFDEQAVISCCEADGEFTINRPRTIGIRARFMP